MTQEIHQKETLTEIVRLNQIVEKVRQELDQERARIKELKLEISRKERKLVFYKETLRRSVFE